LNKGVVMLKDHCDIYCYDEEKVGWLSQRLEVFDKPAITQLFKSLADETRLTIIMSLSIEEELCVCDIANIIGSSISTASHHLRLLKNSGLAKSRREGKMIFYSLTDPFIKVIMQSILKDGDKKSVAL
jgi:DNA-binding transcriptional ArsR family regulator